MRKLLGHTAGIAVLTFTVTACGVAAPINNANDVGADNGASVHQNADEYEVIPERQPSPLDEYLTFVGGVRSWAFLDEESRQRAEDARMLQHQELVAECMHRFGFDYIPHMEWMQRIAGSGDWRPLERAWVAQWGYGFVNRPLGSQGTIIAMDGSIGPNEALLEGMSDSERAAWMSALMFTDGDTTGINGDNGLGFASDYGITWERFGGDEIRDCRDWGWVQQGLADNLMDGSDEFVPLFSAISDLRQAITDDISPADIAWSQCMDDNGFLGFNRQWEAQFQINTEFNELNTGWESFNTPGMALLGQREIEMALADFDCRISTGFAAAQQAYVLERETQFVNDNQVALNALRDAAEQGRLSR